MAASPTSCGSLSCQKDAYLRTLETNVVSCEPRDKHYSVVLFDTVLFPEGGECSICSCRDV